MLGAFCTAFVCSSESMSRFSGIYKIVLVFLSLYEFGKGRSAVVGKISPSTNSKKGETAKYNKGYLLLPATAAK